MRFIFSRAPRWDGSQKPADVESRPLAALLSASSAKENKCTPRGPPAPLSFKEPALLRSAARETASQAPGCRGIQRDCGGGDNAQEEGLGSF